LAKLKAMDADVFPQEVLADEEPKYLRRQKPLEIKRRKFGRRAWSTYLRVIAWLAVAIVVAWALYAVGSFLIHAPQLALIHPEQVELTGNHFVARGNVLEVFSADRGRSVLRIPLNERRRQLESISWVEQASVRRALPNKVQVEIKERTPVAFLRQGSELTLLDVHGVILERPLEGDFHFPVVTGISAGMEQDDRERRMQMFAGFSQQVEAVRVGAMEQVSEVDLSDANDLRATISGLQGGSMPGGVFSEGPGMADVPVLVHFGDGDFENKYRTLIENISQYRAKAGRLESLDLRFNGEVVANPEPTAAEQQEVEKQDTPEQAAVHPAQDSAAKRAP
jgi:cell division protein FtsQ